MCKYVLGGQVHLPGKANDFTGGASTFVVTFIDITDNINAIKIAEKCIDNEHKHAKEGWLVGATLYYGKRVVKNFPSS